VTYSFDFGGTMELARKLWPPTRRVAIIAGVDASGRGTEAQARRALAKYSPELELTWFSGTPLATLQEEVRRLPRDTVIFILPYVLDSRGTSITTREVVSSVSRVANAPVFGFYETLFGYGLLGGHLVPIAKQGRLAGEMAVRVLHGQDPASIPVSRAQMHEYMFDWRELRRWQIPESRLPVGSTVRYREPSLWDLYKYYLLGGIALMIVQSLLIAVLLVNRRQRRHAEVELTENLRFEQVLSTLSSRFLAPPHDGIDQIVAQSLREIAVVLRFQRAALFEFSRGREELLATHQWAVEETEPPPMRLAIGELPWIFAQLGHGRAVRFADPDELPAEATAEREYFRQAGVRSGIAIPLAVGGSVFGAVMFGCTVREQSWNETIVQRLRLFGEILANTISRWRGAEALDASQVETLALKGRLLMAQEVERKRLARELHDDVSQRLAGTAIGAGKLKQLLVESDPLRKLVGNLTDELAGVAEDVHRISRQLHPSILDDLGLQPALQSECDRFSERHEIRVRFRCRNVPATLPSSAALCIYRIAQEALRNAVKHSGAHEVDVALMADAEYLYLSVRDTGRGFDIRETRGKPGLGLASMDERARLVGGVLTVQSQPGKGTLIEARVSLPEDQL
jgi:signal transduction histidine kinase